MRSGAWQKMRINQGQDTAILALVTGVSQTLVAQIEFLE